MNVKRRVVYLDTQDYSRLADAVSGRGDETLRPVYETLRRFAREGTFEFCFSYMLTAELLQLNPQDIDITRRKADVVEELCGANAFPNIFWLLSAELSAAAQRRGFDRGRHLPELDQVVFGGQWIRTELPSAEEMFKDYADKVAAGSAAEARKVLGRDPNRKERRRLEKPLPLNTARRFVAESPLYPVVKGTPLVDKFANALRHRQMPEAAEQFFRFIARPTRLVLAHNYLHSMGFLNDQIQALKTAMYSHMQTLREHFDIVRQTPNADFSREQRVKMLDEVSREHVISLTRKLRDHLIRFGVPPAYFDHPKFEEDLTSLPFLGTWRELLAPYLLMVTDEAPSRRTLQPSDIVDFMHAMYTPHCAVWRSDRYFAALVTPVARRLGCRVVSRLADLPAVLDEICRDETKKS